METWMHVVMFAAGLFAMDRTFSWMERRGWIYWRGVAPVTPERRVSPLRRCGDCGYQVSPRALACPSCGRILRLAWLVLAVLMMAVVVALLSRVADGLLAGWH